jgi:hypothetical protein
MTEIKLGRTPHSLPRRSNSPRRNAVKTGAKTGALSISHLDGSFPVFILGGTIGARNAWIYWLFMEIAKYLYFFSVFQKSMW